MAAPTLPMRINVTGCELTTADPVESYWSFLASRMSEGDARNACSLISSDLVDNELCMSIACMLSLPYHVFSRIVCQEGRGKLGWVRSTEKLWSHSFDRGNQLDSAPPSAPLGMSFYTDELEEPKSEYALVLERSARLRLGTKLQNAGTLKSTIVIPIGACPPCTPACSVSTSLSVQPMHPRPQH